MVTKDMADLHKLDDTAFERGIKKGIESCAAGRWCYDLGKANHEGWFVIRLSGGSLGISNMYFDGSDWRFDFDNVEMFAEIHLPAPEPEKEEE